MEEARQSNENESSLHSGRKGSGIRRASVIVATLVGSIGLICAVPITTAPAALLAGVRAITVFAADKLSDIAGLRRGIDASQEAAETRMGTSVASMADHYRESVQMIAGVRPGSAFLPALRLELGRLGSVAATGLLI